MELLQTEWDVCGRELRSAAERVDTQKRVASASAELASLNRALDHQDLWLDSTAAAAKCTDVAELKSNRAESQVRGAHAHLNFITDALSRVELLHCKMFHK